MDRPNKRQKTTSNTIGGFNHLSTQSGFQVDAQDVQQEDTLEVIPLGGGSEVGRACTLVRFKNKTIMLDCGVHPTFKGHSSLPFWDDFDLSQVDVILISK